MPTIYIRNDETYRTCIEDVTKKDLFFSPVYAQARDCLKDIVEVTQHFRSETKHGTKSSRTKDNCNPLKLRGYPNNIIAFCAKRGYGKTSAMLSFATALEYVHEDTTFWGKDIGESRFLVLDPIDPTELEQTDSVIRTIISRLFQRFLNKSINAYKDQQRRELQQKLLQCFQTCFRMADRQKEKEHHNDDYDDLQRLTELGDSSTFKHALSELFSQYLSFMINTNGSDSCLHDDSRLRDDSRFLVIQIDDADMNTTNAYEVVEDIRKYCVVPNVVILFATDMSLLEQTVEQHFVHSFDAIIRGADEETSKHTAKRSRKRCHDTTISYLDKLIPGLHRINLPDIDAELRDPRRDIRINIKKTPETAQVQNNSHDESLDNDIEGEYQTVLIRLLMEKCQFQLPLNSKELHNFLPKRMRELSHFMRMIQSMKNANCTLPELLLWVSGENNPKCDVGVKILESNLELLMDYFLHDWCELRLSHLQRTVIEEIHSAPATEKLQVALESIQRNWINDEYSNMESTGNWDKLLRLTDELRKRQKRDYAYALELYFQLYNMILFVYDCDKQRTTRGRRS